MRPPAYRPHRPGLVGCHAQDTMVRAGHSEEKAPLICRHSDWAGGRRSRAGLGRMVHAARERGSGGAEVVQGA